MEVKFYDSVDDELLKFTVIIARFNGKLVFCKHKQRDTYELPGGHREDNEDIFTAAKRELIEETGATDFTIEPIFVYSVLGQTRVNPSGEKSFGMVYIADIKFFGEINSEMEKILIAEDVDDWTYPLIEPKIIEEAKKRGYLKIDK